MRKITHYIGITTTGEVGTFRTLEQALTWLNAREPQHRYAEYTKHILSGNCTIRKVLTTVG